MENKIGWASLSVSVVALVVAGISLYVADQSLRLYKENTHWEMELYKATVPDGEYVIEVKEFFNAATSSTELTEDVYWIEIQYYGRIQSEYLVFEYRFKNEKEIGNTVTTIMLPLTSLEVEVKCGEKYVTIIGGRFVHIEYLPSGIPVIIRLARVQSYEDLPTRVIPEYLYSDMPIHVYRIQSDVGADRVTVVPHDRFGWWHDT